MNADARSLVDLGRALFLDPEFSQPRGQACATCHDPDRAFSESRDNGVGRALSLGADGQSFADRNTPALTYAGFVPPFEVQAGVPSGGLFLDGREDTLNSQALAPLLNPLEMGLPGHTAIAARLLANPAYRADLEAHFGGAVLTDQAMALTAMTTAIAAFERSEALASFDSRYDRYLRGEYQMTREEAIGRELFFSDLINCVQCHLNDPGRVSERETFTNHRYHNIGVPVNVAARQANGLGNDHRDPGLAGNPAMQGAEDQLGRFRVPSLRNVAVTAPYMHNGVFATLEAAVAFYSQYTLNNRPSQLNPDTGLPWQPAEFPETVDLELLRDGQPIDQARIGHLVAFLKTLTDRRYEHLLD